MAQMHEIDYQVFGNEMQYVEVELDPMEAAIAEAGGMNCSWMATIDQDTAGLSPSQVGLRAFLPEGRGGLPS